MTAPRRIQPDDQLMREIRPVRFRYEEIFKICKAKGCDEDRARGEDYCDKHVLVDAF
jgi:hypothetical protein